MPAVSLRKNSYNNLIILGFEPTAFVNKATEIVLDLCRVLKVKPEKQLDREATEEALKKVEEKIKEMLEEKAFLEED